eukprot:9268264-Heterocapsa_arctica.AAC.1
MVVVQDGPGLRLQLQDDRCHVEITVVPALAHAVPLVRLAREVLFQALAPRRRCRCACRFQL